MHKRVACVNSPFYLIQAASGAIVIAPYIGVPGLIGIAELIPALFFSGYRDCQGGAGLSSSRHVVNLIAWDDRWD